MSNSTATTHEIKGYVYGLLDDTGAIFYVGYTTWLPQRMSAHKSVKRRMAGYTVLGKYTYEIALEYYEAAWINRLIARGCKLENTNCVGVQVHFASDDTDTALLFGEYPLDPETNWRNYLASLAGESVDSM